MAAEFKLVSYLKGIMKGSRAVRQKKEADGVHVPMFLAANITDQSNHWGVDSYLMRMHSSAYENRREENYLNAADWDDVFGDAEQLGIRVVFIRGGEPLTRKCILERAARYQDMFFPVFTNGSMLDDEYLNFFRLNRNLIPILSQKGLKDLDVSRTGRGSGLYGQLMQTMEELQRRGLIFGNEEVLTRGNYRRLLSLAYVNELRRRGSSIIIFIIDDGSGISEDAVQESDIPEMEERMAALTAGFEDMVLLMQPRPVNTTDRNIFHREGIFAITPTGVVQPATYRADGTRSVKNAPLREILRDELYCI